MFWGVRFEHLPAYELRKLWTGSVQLQRFVDHKRLFPENCWGARKHPLGPAAWNSTGECRPPLTFCHAGIFFEWPIIGNYRRTNQIKSQKSSEDIDWLLIGSAKEVAALDRSVFAVASRLAPYPARIWKCVDSVPYCVGHRVLPLMVNNVTGHARLNKFTLQVNK